MNCASDQRLLFGASPHCAVWLPECPVPVAGYVEHCGGVSTVIALSDVAVVEVNRLRVRQYVLSEGDVLACGPCEIDWHSRPVDATAEETVAAEASDVDSIETTDEAEPAVALTTPPTGPSGIVERPFVRPLRGSRVSLGRVLGKIVANDADAAAGTSTEATPTDPAQAESPQSDDAENLRRAA